jgi:hypothetical protein
MKKLIVAGLLALPLLALPSQAWAIGIPCGCWQVNSGLDFHLSVTPGGGQAGPWYKYWPLEAHFQPPAPTCYPFWPSAMTLPPGSGGATPPAPPHMPAVPATPLRPTAYQPVGYTYEVPSYWYGR